MTVQIPVIKYEPMRIGITSINVPRLDFQTRVAHVMIPSNSLVLGFVSSADTANGLHNATFCFPVWSIEDEECSKLNALKLTTTETAN
jgi:hypothetical protein